MSTATIAPNVTHLPHTAHPLPLREQAFALHCQGLRSPAIAAELGVPERTIRAWIAAALDDLKEDVQLNRRQQLLLAVERQHQLTATAWQQFEREAAARDALLDAALQTLLAASDPSSSADASALPSTRPLHLHLPASTPAPRYLSLILQANKETNRLLGLHTLAQLHLLTPVVPDIPDTAPAPFTNSDIPAESATASGSPLLVGAGSVRSQHPGAGFPPQPVAGGDPPKAAGKGGTAERSEQAKDGLGSGERFPAESATEISLLPAGAPRGSVGVSGGRPNCSEKRFPAESATASQSAPGSVRSRHLGAGFPPQRAASGDRERRRDGRAKRKGEGRTGGLRGQRPSRREFVRRLSIGKNGNRPRNGISRGHLARQSLPR